MSTCAFPGDPDPQSFTIWKFKDLPKLAEEAKECGLTEMVLWMWNAGAQVPITAPFPQLGSEDEAAQAIADCRKIGVNVSLFVSFYSLADPTATQLGLKLPAEGGWTYHPDLIPAFNPYYSHRSATAGANMLDPKWRADVLKSCKYLVDKLTPSICWDQYAGFPGTPNLYELTDQIRELAKAKDPESTFSGESFVNIEMEAKYLDYLWSWGSYGMWGDLHAFTSVFPAPRANPNVNTSWQDAKYCFMDNLFMDVMPRKPLLADSPQVCYPPKEEVYNTIEGLIHHFKIASEGFPTPEGEIYQSVEAPKGELGYYLVSDGGTKPYRMRIRPPSFVNLQAIEKMTKGAMLADLVAVIGTLDIVLGEIDR
jgi:hypothetical protein